MIRSLFILSFSFISIAFQYYLVQKQHRQENGPPPSAQVLKQKMVYLKSDVPSLAFDWDAEIYLVNFTSSQEEKVRKAVELIKKVIRSDEFRQRVLNYSYKGKTEFVDSQGMSNAEIYQKILEGAEKMGNKSKNNIMDVEIELYHQKTNTIGYTYPNTVRIWMNKKYFNKYTPVEVADNLMHEWMHKLGFTHAINWSKERDHSVPYAIGYLVEEMAKKIAQ